MSYWDNSFQSTPSAWRETQPLIICFPVLTKFQSTPSAWRETLCELCDRHKPVISIHSLRMEGDFFIPR